MSNFDKAFASARKSGKKVFSFGGKSYNTKLKSDSAPAKKSTLPKTVKVGPSRPMMSSAPDGKYLSGMDRDFLPKSLIVPNVKKDAQSKSDAPFFKHTETNRSAINDFKQSESRRSSDYSIGKKNAPKVKRAIGKFMIGKAYKD